MLTGSAAILFYFVSLTIILSALVVVFARNSVYSILFLIFTFFHASILFLFLEAEFLAMILVMIYVGAVVVLFLFVVMMLDINVERMRKNVVFYKKLGFFLGAIALGELCISFSKLSIEDSGVSKALINPPLSVSNTASLGEVLYTNYAYYFEISGLILFVAMVGAIVLTLHKRQNVRRQSVSKQVSRTVKQSIELKSVPFGVGLQGKDNENRN